MNHLGGGYFKFWRRWQQKGTMSMAITLCCAPKENHLGNLEIKHASPIVAFVCNHMLLWLWLSQLHWEDPCIVFSLLDMGIWNASWVLKTS